VSINIANAEAQWMKLPSTPLFPKTEQEGIALINGAHIWYAVYGHGKPVILLHGGLANSNYWGNQVFYNQINKMWATQPNFTKERLNSIKTPTWIVDGDHDEAIKREDTEFMAKTIHNAGLLIQPWVSHFSFLQNPKQFNDDLLYFLANDSK